MNDQENKPLTLDRSRFKFGLRQLFYAIALVAAGFGFESEHGLVFSFGFTELGNFLFFQFA